MIIKDGNISTQYSDDLMKTINEEYGYFYDTADNLFFEYPEIRVFVRDESLFSEKESVYYYQDGILNMTFNGTVFFGKLGVNRPLSLDEMTEKEFDAKMARGLAQANAGEGVPVDEFFASLRQEILQSYV